jgi:hypothetical protein
MLVVGPDAVVVPMTKCAEVLPMRWAHFSLT